MSYRNAVIAWLMIAAVLDFAPRPAAAHHSFAMFDRNKTVKLEGVVSRFAWNNPHVFIDVEVPGKQAQPVRYRIESSSTNMLMRQGWKMNSVKVGDRIQVVFNPLRSGEPGGLLIEATVAKGVVLKG